MANPQLENGYIKIATEIWEALTNYRISGEEMKCLMFIIRKTYGWNKKQDEIALSQFVSATGMVKPSVCRAINKLKDKNIITVSKKANKTTTTYQFNKKYKKWKPLAKKLMLTKKLHTIYTIYKRKFPKDFTLTKKLKDYALKKHVIPGEIETVFERFKNYHIGKGTTYKDWNRTWYNWVTSKYNTDYIQKPEPKQESVEEQCS